jgi:hypothetical protein
VVFMYLMVTEMYAVGAVYIHLFLLPSDVCFAILCRWFLVKVSLVC